MPSSSTKYRGYQSGSARSMMPKQLGMQVVNRTVPRGTAQAGLAQHVAGQGVGVPHAATAASDVAKYGSPDPWYTNLVARQNYDAAQAGDGSGNNNSSTGNAWLDNLRNSINSQIADAQRQAVASKKNILLGFGSQALAREVMGKNFDPSWMATISDNPDTSFSTLARENFDYRMNQGVTNENLNAGNLFYSGARGMALQNLGRQHLGNIDTQTKNVRSQLDTIQQQYLAIVRDLQNQLLQASQPSPV